MKKRINNFIVEQHGREHKKAEEEQRIDILDRLERDLGNTTGARHMKSKSEIPIMNPLPGVINGSSQ